MQHPTATRHDSIRQGVRFDRAFVFSNLASTVIACAGLLGNSAVTIIGAMLVATLLAPIMGIGLALVAFDDRLLRRSLITLAAGALLVLATGALVGAVAPDTGPTQEMLSRTSPRLLDLIAALASGAIGAYAIGSPRLSAAIVGVALAVALVPPLATAGIFVARAQWELAQGAFLFAFVSIVAIQVGASITLWLDGYRDEARREASSVASVLRRGGVSLLLLMGLVATLSVHGLRLLTQQGFEAKTRQVLLTALASRPEALLHEVSFTTLDGATVVTASVRSPVRFTPDELAKIAAQLPHAPDGSAPRLRFRHVEVDVVAEGN